MIGINTVVFNALRAGSIPRVVFFSDNLDPRPEPPYVVVKAEPSPEGDKAVFRIFAHFRPGQQDGLDSYIRYELSQLMAAPLTLTGNRRFRPLPGWGPVVTVNSDTTISCDRAFYVPVIIT
jgi:hypothetical protein